MKIIRIGPITIMSTSTRKAYAALANAAYLLHQVIWYTDNLEALPSGVVKEIRRLDNLLSGAISHTPPEDIT